MRLKIAPASFGRSISPQTSFPSKIAGSTETMSKSNTRRHLPTIDPRFARGTGFSSASATFVLEELAKISPRRPACTTIGSVDLSVECSIHTDLRQEYRSAIFCGVGQHLNGMPPFRSILLKNRELPDEVAGVSHSSGRPPPLGNGMG